MTKEQLLASAECSDTVKAITCSLYDAIDMSCFSLIPGRDTLTVTYVTNYVTVHICYIHCLEACVHIDVKSIQHALAHAKDFQAKRLFKFCGAYTIRSVQEFRDQPVLQLSDPESFEIIIGHCNNLSHTFNKAWFWFKCKIWGAFAATILTCGLLIWAM